MSKEQEIKSLKSEIDYLDNDLKNYERENERLKKENRLYGDMISQARDWVLLDFKKVCEGRSIVNVRFSRKKIKNILNIKQEVKYIDFDKGEK